MRLNRIDESVADQIMMSVASMSPVALVGTMTAGAILGDKFLKFLRGDELAQMKRKIERDPAAFDFVEDMRADRKFKKLKRIVNKLARDVKKNPDDPEFKTLFKKAAAELNAYVQTEYKKHSKKFKNRYRGTKVGRQAMRQMMGIKEDAQLYEAESLRWNKMKDSEKKELVDLARVSPRAAFMDWREIPSSMKARLAKYLNKSTKGEYRLVEDRGYYSLKLDERAKVPTYVIDRKTKKIVHGPTDTGDAKLYLDKQVQPRKFMIRQIRGVAKKVGDKV